MIFLRRLITGAIVSAVGMALFVGDGLMLFAFSIVCTGGLSLILWIPAWLGLGKAVEMVVAAFFDRGAVGAAAAEPPWSVARDPVVEFIQRARSKGLGDDEIRHRLRTQGWDQDRVDATLQSSVGSPQPSGGVE